MTYLVRDKFTGKRASAIIEIGKKSRVISLHLFLTKADAHRHARQLNTMYPGKPWVIEPIGIGL